jgi:hypothetical protein
MEIFEFSFHNSSFALTYFFNVDGKAIVWHTPLLQMYQFWGQNKTKQNEGTRHKTRNEHSWNKIGSFFFNFKI